MKQKFIPIQLRGHTLYALHKQAIFGQTLLIMWVGGFKHTQKYAYAGAVEPVHSWVRKSLMSP